MPAIAHAGHWAVNLLYVAPLLIAVSALFVQSRRDRRRVREGGALERRPPSDDG